MVVRQVAQLIQHRQMVYSGFKPSHKQLQLIWSIIPKNRNGSWLLMGFLIINMFCWWYDWSRVILLIQGRIGGCLAQESSVWEVYETISRHNMLYSLLFMFEVQSDGKVSNKSDGIDVPVLFFGIFDQTKSNPNQHQNDDGLGLGLPTSCLSCNELPFLELE